eukprot:9488808-Heterocapsa_arctica.AAC.1
MAAFRNPSYLALTVKQLDFQPGAFICGWACAEVRVKCVWGCVLYAFGPSVARHSANYETQVEQLVHLRCV